VVEYVTRKDIEHIPTKFGFNGFGEVVYYRTYSRLKPDGTQENWYDTVVRVINGLFDIRLKHYKDNGLPIPPHWPSLAKDMAVALTKMEWMPPGRGLWAMGSPFVYTHGSAALNNCGAVDTADLVVSAGWAMDMLMCGVGVGYNLNWNGLVKEPKGEVKTWTITDDREGWVKSVELLLSAYIKGTNPYEFDYSAIRKEGEPIKGFGGVASGPEPLKQLHKRIRQYMRLRLEGKHSAGRTVSDLFNAIGACVVAGNVRRSALINLGHPSDEEFLDLKDYEKNPDRMDIGWMSNNTAVFENSDDFRLLPHVAGRVVNNGEPGILNLVNIKKYGRYGELKTDDAWLANPCGEIPLESFELCNLAEVFPTKCECDDDFYQALTYATFYASTVSLLKTHRPETNAVVAKNRRIGISLSGVTDWIDKIGATCVTNYLRKGYKVVKDVNSVLNKEAGVPEAIRVTTIKPSGTISQLVGVSSGMHFPTFNYAIRRVRVGNSTPICQVLKDSGIPNEPDQFSAGTTVFSFPINQGSTRPATSVSAWEQFALLSMMQREWSDNMVSCTVYFDKEKEGHQIEHMLAQFMPVIKSVSLLPHTDTGAYPQIPYEGINKEEYERLLCELPKIDWSKFVGDSVADKFCNSDTCEV
jgi:ribonucleoside-diphosphate reductase alpha chain